MNPFATSGDHLLSRYCLAVVAVMTAMGLRLALEAWFGPGLPAFITFYPLVMIVALVAGFGPGLLATALSAGVAVIWILPPHGELTSGLPIEQMALAIFLSMGAFMSVLAALYRNSREKAAEYDRETALRENAGQLRLLQTAVQASATAIAITDREGVLQWVNPAFTTLTGYQADEVIGHNPRMLKSGRHPPEFYAKIWETIQRGESWHGQLVNRRKDESLYTEEMTITPVRDGDGAITHFIALKQDITEHKQVEAALQQSRIAALNLMEDAVAARSQAERTAAELRESEQRMRLAQDAAHIGTFDWNIQSDMNVWSPELEAMYGLPPGGLVQTQAGWEKLIHPDDRAAILALVADSFTSGEPVEGEWRVIWPDGSLHWLLGRWQVFMDAAGEPLRMTGVQLDITGRKQSEEKLRRSEALYRGIGESIDYGVWVCDPDGRNIYASESFLNMVDMTQEQCSNFGWGEVLHPDETAATLAAWQECVRSNGIWDREHRFRNKQGGWVHVLARGVPVRGPDGRILCWAGINLDITALKQSEASVRANEQRMRLGTEATGVGIWEWNIMSNQIRWDAQMFRIYGVAPTPDGLVPYSTWSEAVWPEELPEQEAMLQDTIYRTGQNHRVFRIRRASDGECRHIEGVETVRLNAEGRAEWVVGTNLDISERMQAEEEIRRLNTGLECRVRERTTQLVATNKELEAFSYSVSHDLRAPLRAVTGYVRMLQKAYAGSLDAEAHRLLGVVSSEALRMGRLIDDLLAFSRMGRQHVDHVAIDMAALVRAEFDNQTKAAPGPAPRLVLQPLPSAQGDPAMLRQVFANLIGNAIKFSRQREDAVIEVGAASHGGETTYYVKDNGVGFDEKYSRKLFGVFQRLHSASEFEGTGIGLALVQRIIHRHGGHVRATGKPGVGATFYFTLPNSEVNERRDG